ncbi:MAG: hypothetical protein ACOYL6_17130 [Bacteriovoracaceae bacterium]
MYLKAISLSDSKSRIAIDFGCGAGTEAVDLFNRGFVVHAFDKELKAIELVKAKIGNNEGRLYTSVVSFEKIETLPKVDFFYSFHSLPFCGSAYFDQVVTKTIDSVSLGGLYVASFFGPEDDWVVAGKTVGVTAQVIKSKLDRFEILHFEETQKRGMTVMNGEKAWHTIEVIARRL